MSPQPLDIVINRRGRKEAELQLHADPDDYEALSTFLRDWLEGNHWHPGRWGEFEAVVFKAGSWDRLATVRAS
jgi:hypothetical protein